jgi:hypothetical protein
MQEKPPSKSGCQLMRGAVPAKFRRSLFFFKSSNNLNQFYNKIPERNHLFSIKCRKCFAIYGISYVHPINFIASE